MKQVDIYDEINEFFDKWGVLLEDCDIKGSMQYKWMDLRRGLRFSDLQEMHRFLYTFFLKAIKTYQFVKNKFKPEVWDSLLAADPFLAEGQELKAAKYLVQITWKDRPCQKLP